MDVQTIEAVVEQALSQIEDAEIMATIRLHLTKPRRHRYVWDYGKSGETFECWVVLEDATKTTGIVYSDLGFGPQNPWGLVFLAEMRSGMDCSWYPRPEDAFCDSVSATDLRVWRVIRESPAGHQSIEAEALTIGEACDRLTDLNATLRDSPGSTAQRVDHFFIELSAKRNET
jgi:hypothetical protein